MKLLRVDKDNQYGQDLLSTQQLGKSIRSWKWVTAVGLMAVLSYNIFTDIKESSQEKPYIIDTMTGPIITNYEHIMEKFTVQERSLIARFAYEGIRRRVGNAAVDAETLQNWGDMITKRGIVSWGNLGERWKDPHKVKYGFTRTIKVLSVVPDRANPYAFTVEAIEKDNEEGNSLGTQSYRVRLTLFFTDPAVDGLSKIDGVQLHEEESV